MQPLETKKISLPDIGVILSGLYFIIAINFSYSDVFGTQSRYYFLISTALIIYFPFFYLFKKNIRAKYDQFLITFVLFFIYSSLSCFVFGMNSSNQDMLVTFFKIFVIFFIIYYFVDSREKFLFVLISLFLSGFILYYLNKDSIIYSRLLLKLVGTASEARLAGTSGNANQIAMLAVCSLWASVTLFFYFHKKIKFLFLASLPFLVNIIFLSGSKKGLLSLLIFTSLLFIFYIKNKIPHKILFKYMYYVLFFVTILFVYKYVTESYFGDRLQGFLSFRSVYEGDKARLDMALASIKMWLESPLWGKGFDNFRNLSFAYGAKANSYAHSSLWELLSNLGIIGVFLYFYSFYILIKRSFIYLQYIKNEKDIVLLRFGIFLIVITLFNNLFAVMYSHKVFIPLLAAYAGYLYSLDKQYVKERN